MMVVWFRGTVHHYRAAFRNFMKRLNNAVYGNAARRNNRRLRVIPILEKGHDKGWHFHAALEPPARLTFDDSNV